MKTEKKAFFAILFFTILLPSSYLLLKKELTTQALSDGYFMIALFFLMIGAVIWVISSGFFDFFQKNMKQLRFSKKTTEPKEYIPLSKIAIKKPYYWFEVGIFFFLLTIILLLI